MSILFPVEINFQARRIERQSQNDQVVFDAIGTGNIKSLYDHSNEKEITRVLQETQLTIDELIAHCSENNITKRILAGRISKASSRQGSNDEKSQIEVCANVAQQFNIQIENLPNDAFRPTKTGEIVSKKEIKTSGISKNACLKSFDARITGQMEGWIFAKVVFKSGGHQDNVFEEADHLCHWIETFNKPEIYVLLLDTDLVEKRAALQEKYKHIKTILITNHVEFQQYILDNYNNK